MLLNILIKKIKEQNRLYRLLKKSLYGFNLGTTKLEKTLAKEEGIKVSVEGVISEFELGALIFSLLGVGSSLVHLNRRKD